MSKLKLPPGTWIERDLFESPAFNALSGYSPQLLINVLAKRQFSTLKFGRRQKRVCTNCDQLNLTYVEFKRKYGISEPRMKRAIDQLLEKGFLSIVRKGGAFQKDKSIYALSEQWKFWRPGIICETREKECVQRGFCKPKKQIEHTKP